MLTGDHIISWDPLCTGVRLGLSLEVVLLGLCTRHRHSLGVVLCICSFLKSMYALYLTASTMIGVGSVGDGHWSGHRRAWMEVGGMVFPWWIHAPCAFLWLICNARGAQQVVNKWTRGATDTGR